MTEEAEPSLAEKQRQTSRLAEMLRGPFGIRSFALTALFVFAVLYTLYFTRSVLLPLVLALLLSYLLAPLVRGLARVKIPKIIGAAIVLLALFSGLGYGMSFLAAPAAAWMEKVPYSLHRVEEKLASLKKPMQKVTEASEQLDKITGAAETPAEKKTVVEVKESRWGDLVYHQTPEFLAQALMMVILLYFLLAYDQLFLTKLVRVLPTLKDKKVALSIAHEVEACISRYLMTVTLINLALGAAIGLAMFFLGMPNPFLWGAMAAALNFVPYLGATVGIIAMGLAAALSFDNFAWALVFPATYLLIASLEGNFITPMILGHSLTLNPIVIVVALMFWGWMWGIAGAILAVPILAVLKILCDHVEPLAPVGEFLST